MAALWVTFVAGLVATGFVPLSLTTSHSYVNIRVTTATYVLMPSSTPYSYRGPSIDCLDWIHESANLEPRDVLVLSFKMSHTVDVYLMNATQYLSYHGGTTDAYLIAAENTSSGSLRYVVKLIGTHHLVVYNPHEGSYCPGGVKVTVYSLAGTVYRPTVATSTVSSTQVTTSTTTCTRGWLEALFRCN